MPKPYENAPDYVNDPSFAEPDEDTPTNDEGETVFIVDGELDPDNPMVIEVKVVAVHQGQENFSTENNYLGTLLADACCDFNMVFTATKEAAEQVVQDWKASA
jgi:hypothetical protein